MMAPITTTRNPDHWKLEGNTLIRILVNPRQAMFTPVGVSDISIDLGRLQSDRHTIYKYQGKQQVYRTQDVWHTTMAPENSRNLHPEWLWTGETHFEVLTGDRTRRYNLLRVINKNLWNNFQDLKVPRWTTG